MEYVDGLGNQVHPIMQTLFPNNDAVLQADMAGTLQSWFEDHEGELRHLSRPAQSLEFNTSLNHSGQFWRLQ
jgi:hypothetical protein